MTGERKMKHPLINRQSRIRRADFRAFMRGLLVIESRNL